MENYPRTYSHFLGPSDSDAIRKTFRKETENQPRGLVLQVRKLRPKMGSDYLKVTNLSDDTGET